MRPTVAMLLLGCLACGCAQVSDEELAKHTPEPKEAPPAVDKQGHRSIIGRKTREILDVEKVLKDPAMRLVSPKIEGNDPFTQYGSAYSRMASDVGTIPLKQEIKRFKVFNDRFPTYKELMDWMKKNPGVQLPVLPARRLYGYDARTGKMVVLERKESKR